MHERTTQIVVRTLWFDQNADNVLTTTAAFTNGGNHKNGVKKNIEL